MAVEFTFQSVFGNSHQNPRHASARTRSHSSYILSFDLINQRQNKRFTSRKSFLFAARVRRRYFSEGEKRRPEIRLRFAGYTCGAFEVNTAFCFQPLSSSGSISETDYCFRDLVHLICMHVHTNKDIVMSKCLDLGPVRTSNFTCAEFNARVKCM